MTAEQIKAELAVLDERIAQAPPMRHAHDVGQLKLAKRRRDLLLGQLKRLTALSATEKETGNG
jgi:hypothetical protein